jgi:hypothetical protein
MLWHDKKHLCVITAAFFRGGEDVGTNYYFRNKQDYIAKIQYDERVDYAIREALDILKKVVIVDRHLVEIEWKIREHTYYECEMIHIGKRSVGWKPLFQENENFRSVKELRRFYKDTQFKYEIVDQYDRVLTWEELKSNLIDWPGEQNQRERGVRQDGEGYFWWDREFS